MSAGVATRRSSRAETNTPVVVRKPVIVRQPVVFRKPIDREELAVMVAQNKASEQEGNLFFHITRNMVYGLVRRHGFWDSQDEFDDLVCDVHAHIIQGLKYFNPELGCLTTWAYRVVKVFLRARNGKFLKRRRMTLVDDMSAYEHEHKRPRQDISMSMDFRESVKELIKKNKKYAEFLLELFGNPYEDDYVPPPRRNIKEINRKIGGVYNKQWTFYNKVVIPFLMKRFGHQY